MKVRKKEIFDAEQWYPGKSVPGVQGAEKGYWCGCVMAGGPPNIPHIHPTISTCVLVDPGDWVVTDSKGNRCLVVPKEFDEIYEKV